ncbi:MAG: DUF3943 domain-containing protein [Fibrobacteraceae bacterium]|nr:DUF3943 domain-containing protein [Fibrobacteraceae bacterium]
MKMFFSVLLFIFLSLTQASVIPDTASTQDTIREIHLKYTHGIKYKDRNQGNPINPFIVATEITALNVLVWGWDRYVLDKDYARISPSIWKRNLDEGFEWDHNHWAINFYGHPYQGSTYFTAARSAGNDFSTSLLWTAFGSLTWEFFAETEYPAPNDLITTTIGGSAYGEVLHRISKLFYNDENARWYRQMAAFGSAPVGYLQRKAFGEREKRMHFVPVELSLMIGAGSRFGSDYRFGGKSADELDEKWNDHHSVLGLFLEYGRPWTLIRQPFDYFTLNVFSEQGLEGKLIQVDVTGKLANATIHGFGHWMDFAMYLDYDTFYGDLATIGTVSLGAGFDVGVWTTSKLRFRLTNQAYWIILGTSDMGYDDLIQEVHPEYKSDMDNYQYNTGFKYRLLMELFYNKKWTFSNDLTLDALRTLPNSLPHYGAEGWDFLLFNHTKLEYALFPWLSIGERLDTYMKFAAYSTELFEPMSRRIFTFTLYANFNF